MILNYKSFVGVLIFMKHPIEIIEHKISQNQHQTTRYCQTDDAVQLIANPASYDVKGQKHQIDIEIETEFFQNDQIGSIQIGEVRI